MAGKQYPTQVGMVLKDLGIQPIFALSPQAKGRVEKLFGTLQDRLVAELKLAGITDMEAANQFLHDHWIDRFNKRFKGHPATEISCFRPIVDFDLHRVLTFRYQATVANDNAVRLGGKIIDIPPGPRGRSYAKARVDVRQHLDGSWSVYHFDQIIARADPSPLHEPRTCRRKIKSARAGDELILLYPPAPQLTPTYSRGHFRSAVSRTYCPSLNRATLRVC